MFDLTTGKIVSVPSGNTIWFDDDTISCESAGGMMSFAASPDVRACIADFVADTYDSILSDKRNTDIDFIYNNFQYRLALDENYQLDEPVVIYIICGPIYLIWQIDRNLNLDNAE